MNYEFKLPKEKYYKGLLLVLNVISSLNMTEFEVDILATMLERNITEINAATREILRKVLNKDKFNTNNYIKRLKDKNIVLPKENSKVLYINPNITDALKDKSINFNFELV